MHIYVWKKILISPCIYLPLDSLLVINMLECLVASTILYCIVKIECMHLSCKCQCFHVNYFIHFLSHQLFNNKLWQLHDIESPAFQ